MESLDVILFGLCVAIALALFLFSAFRLYQARTSLNAICAAACTVFLAKTTISISYFKVTWLNPKARYVMIYFTLNTATILLYYLYERRLALFFRTGGQYFRAAMYLFIGLYAATTVAMIAVFAAYAKNTASGGYTSDGPGAIQVKVTNYLLDMAVGVTILAGTFFALGRLLDNNKTLQNGSAKGSAGTSTSLYQIVIKSDCTKFAVVFAIEIYKAVTSTDPTGQTGALPTANNAFQHLIDAIKITIMVINLYLPSGLAKIASKASSAGGSTLQASGTGNKEGYVHGGQHLYNPLMELHALLRSDREKDKTDCVTFEEALEVDRLKHADAKIQWEKRVSFPDLRHLFADGEKEYEDTDRPVKMEDVQISGELTYRRPRYVTFEEFARARPFMSSFQHWVHALEKLQEIPDPVLPEEPEFEWDEKAPLVEWSSMSTYWKGVLAFTGDQLVEVFGKVSFLEKELIPLSMVESFMNKKVEWDQ